MATVYITIFIHLFRQTGMSKSVDLDEMLQNAASHLGLHCLPIIQQFLDTTMGSKFYLLKF